jgi:hypothetical protein
MERRAPFAPLVDVSAGLCAIGGVPAKPYGFPVSLAFLIAEKRCELHGPVEGKDAGAGLENPRGGDTANLGRTARGRAGDDPGRRDGSAPRTAGADARPFGWKQRQPDGSSHRLANIGRSLEKSMPAVLDCMVRLASPLASIAPADE